MTTWGNVTSWTVFPGNCTVTRDLTYLDGGAMKAHMPDNSLYNQMILNGPDGRFTTQSEALHRGETTLL